MSVPLSANLMKESRFNSSEEFYEFIEVLSGNLKEAGFPEARQQLHAILHEISWSTSSEPLGEIKIALLKLTEEHRHGLPQSLLEDINLCIKNIEDSWHKANR